MISNWIIPNRKITFELLFRGRWEKTFTFMFSLDSKVKAELKNENNIAVWHAGDIGPGFSDYDLLLYNNCLKDEGSFVDITHFSSDNLKFIGMNKNGRCYTRIIDYETYLVKL